MPPQTDGLADLEPTAERLIALGRDREAVVAATRDHEHHTVRRDVGGATNPGGPMAGADQLDEIIPLLRTLVSRLTADQLEAPTPCEAFTVTGVLEHMIGGATAFAPAFRGEQAAAAAGPTAGDVRERWSAAMDDLLGAVRSPGVEDRVVAAPFGEVPSDVFARFVAFDGLVHGWDLAVASGQPYAPRDGLVDEVAGFARQALAPEMRDGDTFAAEAAAPADATPLQLLVAFSGRRPAP